MDDLTIQHWHCSWSWLVPEIVLWPRQKELECGKQRWTFTLALCLIRIREGWDLYDGSFTVYATALMNLRAYFKFNNISEATKYTLAILRKFPFLVTGQDQTGLSPGFSYCWLRRNTLAACKAREKNNKGKIHTYVAFLSGIFCMSP